MAERLVCELHTHTMYSPDSLIGLEDLLAACRRKGLDRVAVTDHDTIAGALRLKEMDPERVIVGQEIHTTQGELIAYFLHEPIPAHLSPQETIERVRAQGGLVGVPHPLDSLRREAMGRDSLIPILEMVDFLEVMNGRCILPSDNRAARVLAAESGLPGTGGSDAHSLWELGRVRTILSPFDSPDTFLESLRKGEVVGKESPFWVHFASTYARLVAG